MEDIFQWCREGNAMQVRVWLDDTEHDMNQGYVWENSFLRVVALGLASFRVPAAIFFLNVIVFSNARWHNFLLSLISVIIILFFLSYYFLRNLYIILYSTYSDDHGFSPLHWCCKEGHLKLAELLVSRGARINATNRGDDTPLHLASAHGHKEIVQLVMQILFYV